MRSGIARILADRRALRGTSFYKIYKIFHDYDEPRSGLPPVDISGFSHFFGFERRGWPDPRRVKSPNT